MNKRAIIYTVIGSVLLVTLYLGLSSNGDQSQPTVASGNNGKSQTVPPPVAQHRRRPPPPEQDPRETVIGEAVSVQSSVGSM